MKKNQKEDFLVVAEIKTDTSVYSDVPCKVYLPERTHEKPKIIFKPTQQHARPLSVIQKASLDAKVIGFGGDIEATIKSPEIYLKDHKTHLWGQGIYESTIHCEPENLEVIKNTGFGEKSATLVYFWISPNSFITPFAIFTKSYTGEIKKENAKIVEYNIGDFKYSFEHHYKYKTEDNGDLIQWHYLVAGCETTFSANETKAIQSAHLQDLDDFLLLISFASRQRTVCMGWEASDSIYDVTFYRGNYRFPEIIDQRNNEELINIANIEEFVKTAGSSFQEYENKLSIRSSIFAALSSKDSTIEKGFLTSFAGLETLILDFRRNNDLEFNLEEVAWKKLRHAMKSLIKTSTDPMLGDQQRNSIYLKLNELNRISLSEAFERFCAVYSIPHDDIWPLFGNKEMAGLSDIRNSLIHGNPIPNSLMSSLIVAKHYLEILHERSLLRILKWNISKSDVNISKYQNYTEDFVNYMDHSNKIKNYLLTCS